jgi:hypothetical protein
VYLVGIINKPFFGSQLFNCSISCGLDSLHCRVSFQSSNLLVHVINWVYQSLFVSFSLAGCMNARHHAITSSRNHVAREQRVACAVRRAACSNFVRPVVRSSVARHVRSCIQSCPAASHTSNQCAHDAWCMMMHGPSDPLHVRHQHQGT